MSVSHASAASRGHRLGVVSIRSSRPPREEVEPERSLLRLTAIVAAGGMPLISDDPNQYGDRDLRVGQAMPQGKTASSIKELQVEAWQEERNQLSASVDWRFTTEDARIKLRKLYPSIEL